MTEFPYTSSAKRIQRLITLIEGNKSSAISSSSQEKNKTKLEFWLTFGPNKSMLTNFQGPIL